MNTKTIEDFLPLNSRKKVTELTTYISGCNSNQKLPIELCIKHIKDTRLREIFFLKCINQNLYPGKEDYIRKIQMSNFKRDDSGNTKEKRKSKCKKKIKNTKMQFDYKRTKSNSQVTSNNAPKNKTLQKIPSPNMEGRIFAKVKAKDLTLRDGIILYKEYSLHTVRVKRTSQKILNQIEHEFHLVKDIKNSSQTNDLRFHFWPFNDLSLLLGEIERIKTYSNISSDEKFPQKGRFFLPWKFVLFYDGIMYLEHPNSSKRGTIAPFQFRHPYILKSYRDILPYIESRCQSFDVEANDGIIYKIHNFNSFKRMIPHFYEKSKSGVEEIEIMQKGRSGKRTFSKSEFSNRIKQKSPYIAYLSEKQSDNRLIYYLVENICHLSSDLEHDEYGYLFTINEKNDISTLIFENVTDESRCSIIFKVKSSNYDMALEFISRFLSSDIKNKRQILARKCIQIDNLASVIVSINRVIHTDFDGWKHIIAQFM